MKKTLMIAAIMAAPVLLSGCDKKAEAPKAEAETDAMGDMEMPADTKMVKSTGTVMAIDSASGKITLEHDAIDAIEWPAMTMGFKSKPELLEGIDVGDKVDFDLTVSGNAGEVTSIKKR